MSFKRILGLDILPGYSPLKNQPKYAAAILIDGRIVKRIPELSRAEIPGLVKQYSIEAIAIDNIFEIAPDDDSLMHFFKSSFTEIPSLIQTTLINGEEYSIETLCMIAGLCKQKPGPLETAEISAILAYNNIGSQVLLFEEETKITISRGRVPGPGGMSRERYKRNIELLVLRKTREVKEKLEKNNIDFDLFVRKSGAGLESSTFIVYCSREKLKGIVKRSKGYDLVVDIEPIKKEKIEFVPLGKKIKIRPLHHRYLIVGVDPGISTGVAILDLKGNIIDIFTKRWLSRNQLSKIIYSYGKPVLIATDVVPPASYVRKLAASLNAQLYVPQRVMSLQEKREIASQINEKYGIKVRDSHQRDALSAAYKSFLYHKPKFDQVEKEVMKYGIRIPVDEAKVLVLKGYPVSEAVKNVLRKYLAIVPKKKEIRKISDKKVEKEKMLEQNIAQYQEIINQLVAENKQLKKELNELEEEVTQLRARFETIGNLKKLQQIRDREIAKLRFQLQNLYEQQNRLKETIEELKREKDLLTDILSKILINKGFLAPKLSYIIDQNSEFINIKDSKLVIDQSSFSKIYSNPERLEALSKKFDTFIFESKAHLEKLWERIEELDGDIPRLYVLPDDSVEFEYFYYINYDSLEKNVVNSIIPNSGTDLLSQVKNIIEDYRKKRKRELKNSVSKV